MATLRFQVDLGAERPAVDVPLEIRRPDLSLAGRSLSSQALDLSPGTYYVTAELPSGEQLVERIDLAATEATVRLTAEPEATFQPPLKPARRSSPERGSTRRSRSAAASLSEGQSDPEEGWRRRLEVKLYEGNLLTGEIERLPAPEPHRWRSSPSGRRATLVVEGGARPGWLWMRLSSGEPITLAVPASASHQATLELHITGDDHLQVSPHLEHSVADLVAGYLVACQFQAAELTTRSTTLRSETLLTGEKQDPVAALVVGYALLRSGELDDLEPMSALLRQQYPSLPDTAVLCGELLARRGRHRAAATFYSTLLGTGLPLFADGVFLAVQRLRLYVARLTEGDLREQAGQALQALLRFAPVIEPTRLLTAFRRPPLQPRDEPAAAVPGQPAACGG